MCSVLQGLRGGGGGDDVVLDCNFLCPPAGLIFVTDNERGRSAREMVAAVVTRRQCRGGGGFPFAELGLVAGNEVSNTGSDSILIACIDSGDMKGPGDVEECPRCTVCNDGGGPVATDMFTKYNTDAHLRIQEVQTTALHVACSLSTGAEWVKMLCANGALVNEQNLEGQTPLHLALLGDVRHYGKNMEECLTVLLQSGADVNVQDLEGDSPLLYLRIFLKEGLYEEVCTLARVLLHHGANPNLVNRQGRSLLTYSVAHLDEGIALSRLLVNHGATVWSVGGGGGGARDDIGGVDQSSSFTWFLKSVIRVRRLENCSLTLRLLSQAMGEHPKRMHAHVLRTMFRHVRCFRVLGPVFLQLKLGMMRYWSQPHDLKYLCWQTLRRSLGPKRLVSATPSLGLPRPLQRYVLME